MSALGAATRAALAENVRAVRELTAALEPLGEPLGRAATLIADGLLHGRKVLCCGNGGSAADSLHLAAEFAGRYVLERPGAAAIDLCSNVSLTTALINDYPADQLFARGVQALGATGDVLIAFSTSGNSPNILRALDAAKARQMKSIAFLGKGGGKARGLADVELIVPSQVTARIQESHQVLFHTLCDVLDPLLAARQL